MSATPEWVQGLDAQATDAIEPEDAYDPAADAQAELDSRAPPPELTLEDEPQVAERVQQAAQTVPLATLLEERKRLQAQLDEERAARARFERLESELRALREQRQQAQVQPPPKAPLPEYLEDPKGYVDATREDLIERLKRLEGDTAQVQQATQQQMAERQLMTALQASEAEFAAAKPDYLDALTHLRQIKQRELELTYPDLKAADRLAALRNMELGFGAQMLAKGRNPSEAAYELAQALGYQPKQAQNRPNGQDQAAASGVDRRRLQGMGGGAARNAGTDSELERLMEGGQDEFDQAMGELFGTRRR